MNYGQEILGERAKNRINQVELSEAVGISRPTLVDIENDRIGIDEPTYNRIIDCINEIAAKSTAAA